MSVAQPTPVERMAVEYKITLMVNQAGAAGLVEQGGRVAQDRRADLLGGLGGLGGAPICEVTSVT